MARKTQRGRRRRGRFGFLYAVLSFLLVAAALLVGSVVFFRANTISVEGNARYTAAEIVEAAGVEPGQNLFRVNRPRTYQRILAALPYIRDVSIRRDLPDRLVITVTETRAVVSLSCAEGHFLLDPRGKVVEQVAAPPAALPEVTGLTPLPPVVGTALEADSLYRTRLEGLAGLLTALEEKGMMDELLYVDLSSASELVFGYTERFTAQLPLTCDYAHKLSSLQYVVEHLEENETGLIDLTRSDETHFIPR